MVLVPGDGNAIVAKLKHKQIETIAENILDQTLWKWSNWRVEKSTLHKNIAKWLRPQQGVPRQRNIFDFWSDKSTHAIVIEGQYYKTLLQ